MRSLVARMRSFVGKKFFSFTTNQREEEGCRDPRFTETGIGVSRILISVFHGSFCPCFTEAAVSVFHGSGIHETRKPKSMKRKPTSVKHGKKSDKCQVFLRVSRNRTHGSRNGYSFYASVKHGTLDHSVGLGANTIIGRGVGAGAT